MLNRNPTAQATYPLNITIRNGFGVIQEPIQPSQRDLFVNGLEDVQEPCDRLVVGGMNPEGPTVGSKKRYNLL